MSHYLSKKNLGYGEGNNKIIELCKTKYLFILNPDTILQNKCDQIEKEPVKTIKLNRIDLILIQ